MQSTALWCNLTYFCSYINYMCKVGRWDCLRVGLNHDMTTCTDSGSRTFVSRWSAHATTSQCTSHDCSLILWYITLQKSVTYRAVIRCVSYELLLRNFCLNSQWDVLGTGYFVTRTKAKDSLINGTLITVICCYLTLPFKVYSSLYPAYWKHP
jgi:hypothetical protein